MHLSWSTETRMVAPYRNGSSPDHGQLVHAVDERVVLERHLRLVDGQRQGRDPPGERSLYDLELDPDQRLPQALVRAETEPHVVTRVLAADVQLVGGRKDRGVPVADLVGHD